MAKDILREKEIDILPQLLVNNIIAGAIYALVALGFNLIYGSVKFFDLGYGALTAVGAYGVFFTVKRLGYSPLAGIIVGILVAGIIGYLAYRFVYAPLRRRKESNMVLLVASLGVFTVLQAVVAMLFTSQFRVLTQSAGLERTFHVGSAIITQTQVIILGVGAVISTVLFCFFHIHCLESKCVP